MPLPNEHACRLMDPDEVKTVGSKYRNSDGKRYRILFGKPKDGGESVEQSYRYNKEIWNEGEAKKHCKDHDGKFEPAGEENELLTDEIIDLAVEEGYLHIVVNENHNFSKKSAKVLLDRESGVKALVCRLSGEDTAAIKMLLFPEDPFDKEGIMDKWLFDHPLGNYFVKQLIYTGRWKHPQDENKFVSVTGKDIIAMQKNVKAYLARGGSIPVVEPPHPPPNDPVAKIEQTRGDLCAVFQWDDSELLSVLRLDHVASAWVREGKVKDVSPSIVYDVHTAHGVFDVLFDHICITPDPYLIKQSKFQPLIAERYSKAVVFCDDNVISYEDNQGGNVPNGLQKAMSSLWAAIKSIKNVPGEHIKKIKNNLRTVAKEAGLEDIPSFEGEGEHSMTEEERKEFDRLRTENASLKEDKKTAEEKVKTSEKELEDIEKANDTADMESFKGDVEKMVEMGQVKPLERDQLVAQYTTIEDRRTKMIEYGDTKVSYKESLLAPYKLRPKKGTTQVALAGEATKLRTKDGVTFERDSVQGRNALHTHVMNGISDLDIQSYIREQKLSPFTDRDKVRALLYMDRRNKVMAESTSIND